MAPFKEVESSQLCVKEVPGWRPVRRLTPFEKAMNMKNMLSLLIQMLPPSPKSMMGDLDSNWTMPWDRTGLKGTIPPGSFSPTFKHSNHIDTRSLQMVRKHKGRRSWLVNPLTKKEKVRKHRSNLIFHNIPRLGSSQVTLTQESNIVIQPSKMFVKRHCPKTSSLPYDLRSLPESLKPPIKIMIQFTRTRRCEIPLTPSLEYVTVDPTKTNLESKVIETRSEYSVNSKRFNSPNTSSSSESFSSSITYRSSVSSVVMITLPKALSETLKCASGLTSETGKVALEKNDSKSATSHSLTSTETMKRNSSFSVNLLQSSHSSVSSSTSGCSVCSRNSTKKEGRKGYRKLATKYLRKRTRCRRRLKGDSSSARKYLSKKGSRRRWVKSRKFKRNLREKNNKCTQAEESNREKEPKNVSRKRGSPVAEPTYVIRSEKPAKLPRLTRSISVMAGDKDTEYDQDSIGIEQGMNTMEPIDLGKPLKTIESGHTLSSSEKMTSATLQSPRLTPAGSRIPSPIHSTRKMSHSSKFPAKMTRKTKGRVKKENGNKINNSNMCPKTQLSRRRCPRARSNKYFLPKEMFLLRENQSLLNFVHSMPPKNKGLSPTRSVFGSKKSVPQRSDSVSAKVSKGRLPSCKRSHSATRKPFQTGPLTARKTSLSGTPRDLNVTQRHTPPTKMHFPAEERPRSGIRKAQGTSGTKPSPTSQSEIDTSSAASTYLASHSLSQPGGVGRILPEEKSPLLKTGSLNSKGGKPQCTPGKLPLTPLLSSPSVTPPSSNIKPSYPASWYLASRTVPESSLPSNVKSPCSSVHSTRGISQTVFEHSQLKRPPTAGSRSSTPAKRTRSRSTCRSNRSSPTRQRWRSPSDNTKKQTSEIQLAIMNACNSKRALKRKFLAPEKSNTKLKQKKSPILKRITPTKSMRTLDFKIGMTIRSEKKIQSTHSSRRSSYSVEPPHRGPQVPSRAMQTSRPLRTSMNTIQAMSPISRKVSPIGHTVSSIGRAVYPSDRTEYATDRMVYPIVQTVSAIGKTVSPFDQTVSPIGPPQTSIGCPSSPIAALTTPIGQPASPIGQPMYPIGQPASPIRRPASSIRRPASSIRRPASSIRRPVSSTCRPSTSICRPVSSICRPVSPIGRSTSSIRRLASPIRRSASLIHRKVPFSRSASPISRPTSPIRRRHSGILKTSSRDIWVPNMSTCKSRGFSRPLSPAECTSNQNSVRNARAKSQRLSDPRIIRFSHSSSRKQNPGMSCTSSFLTRTPPLTTLTSSTSSFPFPSSLQTSRCNQSSIRSVSSTSRSLNTPTRSMTNFSRNGNKSGRIPRPLTEHGARLNRISVTPSRATRTSVTDTHSRSENICPLNRNTRTITRATHRPSRIIHKLTTNSRPPKRIARRQTKITRIPSSVFFTPDIYFSSPTRPICTPRRPIRTPAKITRVSSRTKCSPSSKPNLLPRGPEPPPPSPSISGGCTAQTQTAQTQSSLSSTETSQEAETYDKTTSCIGKTSHERLSNSSRQSSSCMHSTKPYLQLLEKKDSSHKNAVVKKIRLLKRELKST